MTTIKVLNEGYVRLVDHMGSDLTVANAARVSYAKQSFELSDRDIKLIKFLAREGHTSPFRHAITQFEVYAPLMVARQWWKYVVGSAHYEGTGDSLEAWNESSRRYITEEPVFINLLRENGGPNQRIPNKAVVTLLHGSLVKNTPASFKNTPS